MKLTLRLAGDEKIDKVSIPIAATTVINKGDLVSYESGKAVLLSAAAKDASFAGVSEMTSIAGDDFPDLVVETKGIYTAKVASATYTIGQALAYNATNDELEASTANTIAWAYEDKSTTTSLKVRVDVVGLNKLFAINA